MLYCAGESGNPNYLFTISANGSFIITSYSGKSGFVNITNWQQSSYINKYPLLNNLKIAKSGEKISFYIYSLQVQSLPFDGGYGARPGFVIFDKQLVEFDDFKVEGKKK